MKLSWTKYLKAISCREEDLRKGIGKVRKARNRAFKKKIYNKLKRELLC